MIQGKIREGEEEVSADELYRWELACFFGVEGTYYGIEDELYGLGKLIEVVGNTIVNEERELIEIRRKEQENYGEDYNPPTPIELAAWHKKAFRQFTYKAIMSLVQSTFEAGVQRLHQLLVKENQIEDKRGKNKEKLRDTLDSFIQLDSSFASFWNDARPYTFIRNKLEHQDGVFYDGDSNIDAIRVFVKDRQDISITDEGFEDGRKKYRLKINKSSVLTDYLKLVNSIFARLSITANNRPAVIKK